MGMLYNVYTKQVSSYCKTKDGAQISNCKHNMMMYGVVKLNEMDESSLDKMDPYQRNADNLRKFFIHFWRWVQLRLNEQLFEACRQQPIAQF